MQNAQIVRTIISKRIALPFMLIPNIGSLPWKGGLPSFCNFCARLLCWCIHSSDIEWKHAVLVHTNLVLFANINLPALRPLLMEAECAPPTLKDHVPHRGVGTPLWLDSGYQPRGVLALRFLRHQFQREENRLTARSGQCVSPCFLHRCPVRRPHPPCLSSYHHHPSAALECSHHRSGHRQLDSADNVHLTES